MLNPTLLVELQKVTTSGYHNISSYVKAYSISRGRSRQLERFEAGTFSLTLNNNARAFDPTYTLSPFNGAIVPRAIVKITINGTLQYTGIISDWNLAYDVSGESTATAVGADLFSILANQTFQTATSTAGYTTYVFANSAYSDSRVGFTGITTVGTFDAGQTFLDTQNILNTNVLEYWQLLERTERGYLFSNKAGSINFRDRRDNRNSGVSFADDNTGIKYSELEVTYGTELLFNKAILSRRGGVSATVENNTASGTLYGYSTYEDSDLLYRTDDELVDAATSLVAEYGDPEYRFDTATFLMHGLSTADQNSLLGLEMTDNVTVKFTPNGVGTQISKLCKIIGISHNADPASHSLSVRFEEIYTKYLILDSGSAGLLDSNVLGW